MAGEVHDVRVTVRWLETRSEPEDPDSNFVHLCCEVWPGNDSDGTLADRLALFFLWQRQKGIWKEGPPTVRNVHAPGIFGKALLDEYSARVTILLG